MRRLILACLLFATTAHAQTLRIALREDADILDPTLARTYVGRIVFMGLCDKLFDINEKLEIVPQLATGYEWTDPKTLILHLRQGVTFHDGEVFDAAAVKYGLERHMTMQGSFRRSDLGAVDHVDVVDPATVKISLKAPSAPFVAQLADRSGMIVAPKAAEAAGRDFGLRPVCTGPFKFVERVAQDRIVLERFDGYWDKDAVKLDRVVYQPITDSSARLAALQAGSIDLSEQIVAPDVDQVKRNPKLRLAISDYLGYQGATWNLANGPRSQTPAGQDSRVRRAFELALDRDALVQVVYNGLYTPNAQAVPASSPFYVPGFTPPKRDVAAAKALLKEAGVKLPLEITITAPNNPDIRQLAEVMQAMVAEAGFDLKINVMEFAASLDAEVRGDFQLYMLAWSGRVDGDGNMSTFFRTGGSDNQSKYSNPDVDALLDQARATPDVAARRDIYAKMWPILHQDQPITYLFTQKNIVGMSTRVTGFRPVPDGMIRLQGLSLAAPR